MKKLFPVLLLIPVTVCGLLSGCGGGSGKSGDDGNTSLSGQQVSLFEGGSILFQLQFSGQDVDVIRMDTRAVYDGVYTYRFNSGENAGVLNIAPAANSSSACTMANVNIAFDDAGRNAGVAPLRKPGLIWTLPLTAFPAPWPVGHAACTGIDFPGISCPGQGGSAG